MGMTAPVLLLVLVGVLALMASSEQPGLRAKADLGRFNPGNIISDGVFYDSSTMSAGQIQAFLDNRNSGLRGFRMDTFTRTSSPCAQYAGAPQETAATIIHKVALACGINPQSLLVILQKEQGLITSATASSEQLRKAMGYGCPDTPTGCDATWNGFFNQVYMASRQFKLYQANPTKYGYVAGRTNSIGYQVAPADPTKFNYMDRDCGRASVYIENQATAGLYNYTPYVPNAAALRAGYGKGDSCSAYGNRNFYSYFTDWFGSTQSSGGASIAEKVRALAAVGRSLGSQRDDVTCGLVGGGCRQRFANGDVYWSAATGAHDVRGEILARYTEWGGPGGMGYPTADDRPDLRVKDVWYSNFQGGDIVWSPSTRAQVVRGDILQRWYAAGSSAGYLGLPVTSDGVAPGGKGYVVEFQRGSIFWSPTTGARHLRGAILAQYLAWGGPPVLGYPRTDDVQDRAVTSTEVWYSHLEGGDIVWSPGTGAQVVRGEILQRWYATGGSPGGLGLPVTSDAVAPGGKGYVVEFQRGSIYWSPTTGAHDVRGAILARYREFGGPSVVGFPVGDDSEDKRVPGTEIWYSNFQTGDIVWSPGTGAQVVRGAILRHWLSLGSSAGALGLPVSSDAPATGNGGYVVHFQRGSIYWSSATGPHAVRAQIATKYRAVGGPAVLGYPLGEQGTDGNAPGVTYTNFQGGDIVYSQATGAQVVRGAVLARWLALGASAGALGLPVSSDAPAPGGEGTVVDFQRGSIYWSPATGAHDVRGAILARYREVGGPTLLGYPTRGDTPERGAPGAWRSTFQRGDVVWTAETGAQVLRGEVLRTWLSLGGAAGQLGVPRTSSTLAPDSGEDQVRFGSGSIYWSVATGVHWVPEQIDLEYRAGGGPVGPLGFPVSDPYVDAGRQRVQFQHGVLPE